MIHGVELARTSAHALCDLHVIYIIFIALRHLIRFNSRSRIPIFTQIYTSSTVFKFTPAFLAFSTPASRRPLSPAAAERPRLQRYRH
jgi:hypothetical protein